MTFSSIKQRLSLWNILFFLFGLAVLFFLLKQIDFRNLVDLIFKIKPEYLLLGGILYLCKGLLRAFRFKRANQDYPLPFLKMLRLTFASSLASQVLPLKLGELTYVYLLKRDNRASISHGLSSLMIMRLIDEQYLRTPYYGARKFVEWLLRQGQVVRLLAATHG